MSEDTTGETHGGRSFEERVFVRFDAIDTGLGSVDARLGSVEARLEVLEAKSYDTRPIWERALAEIASLRESVNERFDKLERKFDVLADDMIQLRADQKRVNRRLDKVETEHAKPS